MGDDTIKLLVVVDMQKDFVDVALGTPEAVAIVPNVQHKVENRRTEGWFVVYTRDTHTENYLDTQEGQNLPVPHCIRDTPGWEIVPELCTRDCLMIDKPSFGSLELAHYAAGLEGPEEIELVCLCTDIRVISNALLLKAAVPEVPISVGTAFCAGVTLASHANALHAIKMCQIKIQ